MDARMKLFQAQMMIEQKKKQLAEKQVAEKQKKAEAKNKAAKKEQPAIKPIPLQKSPPEEKKIEPAISVEPTLQEPIKENVDSETTPEFKQEPQQETEIEPITEPEQVQPIPITKPTPEAALSPQQKVPLAAPVPKPAEAQGDSPAKIPSPTQSCTEEIKETEYDAEIPPPEVPTPLVSSTKEICAISADLTEMSSGGTEIAQPTANYMQVSQLAETYLQMSGKSMINNYVGVVEEGTEEKNLVNKAEQFKIRMDLEEQMRRLQRKKAEEESRRREESMRMKKLLFKQLISGKDPAPTENTPVPSKANNKVVEKKKEEPPATISAEFERLVSSPDAKPKEQPPAPLVPKEPEKPVEPEKLKAKPIVVPTQQPVELKPLTQEAQAKSPKFAEEISATKVPEKEDDKYQFPPLKVPKPPLVVTPKMQENKGSGPLLSETGHFAESQEIEEDYANASFDKDEEPVTEKPKGVTFGKEAAVAPMPEAKTEEEDNGKQNMIVVDFGNNIDQDKKMKQFLAFRERRMKQEEEKRDHNKNAAKAKAEATTNKKIDNRSHSTHESPSKLKRNVSYERIPPSNELYLRPQIKKEHANEDVCSKKVIKPKEEETKYIKPTKLGKPPKDNKEVKNHAKPKKTPVFSKPNNHQLIKNSIVNVCLAGDPNKKRRTEVLEALNSVSSDRNVIVLFKDMMGARQDFKALYSYNEEAGVAEFVYGPKDSPAVLEQPMVNDFYRYDSGAKEFRHIPGNRNFSIAVDAVSLKPLAAKKKANLDKLV